MKQLNVRVWEKLQKCSRAKSKGQDFVLFSICNEKLCLSSKKWRGRRCSQLSMAPLQSLPPCCIQGCQQPQSSVSMLLGLHPDGLQTSVIAQAWCDYRGSKAMVTLSTKERAAEDMGIAINNFLFSCKLCSPMQTGRNLSKDSILRLTVVQPLTEPEGRGEQD